MRLGRLKPDGIAPLMDTLTDGYAKGQQREGSIPPVAAGSGDILRFCQSTEPPHHKVLKARLFTRGRVCRTAKALAEAGDLVSVIEVLPSTRALTVRFGDDGYWHHRIGQYGRTHRSEKLYRYRTNRRAFVEERERIRAFRD